MQTVTKDFETDGIFGIGIGYQLNSWFRGDLTVEYRTPRPSTTMRSIGSARR